MKKKFNSVYFLFFALLAAFFQLSYSGNPPNGHTGAPPSGNTCASSAGGCHSGGAGTGMVTITGLPATVTPNTVYPITVTVTRTNGVPSLAGFQMVVQQSNNANAGTLTNPGPNSNVEFSGGKYYFEHSPAQPYSGNSASFTVDWTAPSSSNGAITMYAAGNLADGSGNTNGDAIVTTSVSANLVGGGPITVSITSTNVSCFGGNNGSATASASGGGGPPYTYSWSNGGSSSTISNIMAGTYTVSVTNASGGSGTGSVTITQPTQLTVAIINQTNINCITPVGTATGQANGGTGAYIYNWSNGQTGPTATLTAGTHTVSVTDANACVATTTVIITSNTVPPISEAGPPAVITCTTPTPMLNGTGSSTGANIQYLWTTSNGTIVSGATTLTPTVSAAGTYTLTVTNNTNGCTAMDATTVTTSTTPPISNAGADAVLTCTTTSLQLNGSSSSQGSNFTYLWTTSNGHIVSGATTLMPTVDAAGTYCLKVTNTLNGCTATDCASVTQNTTPPVANAGSAAPLTCTTLQVTLNGSASSQGAGFSYLWTTTTGNIVSGATTLMPVVNLAAVYTLTVTNAANGCTASSSVTVTSNTTLPTASAGPDKVLNCNNTSVVLNGSGSSQGPNFTYSWSGPGIVSGGNTPNPTVNAAGNYVLLVTNTSNGCTNTDAALVTQTPALQASIAASQNVACNGGNTGSATATAAGGTGPYIYAWSNNANTSHIANIAAGTYTVSITDADNCVDTASLVITQPTALNPNASATGETSVGANNGTATASPTGGVPGYSYSWSNGASTPTITGLAPGNYTVSVADANNCTANQTVTVASFSCAGVVANTTAVNPSCHGGSDGAASVIVSGSTGPFLYLWSNGDTTASISNLSAGNYTVSILDGNGCNVTGNVSLIAPTAINLTIQQTNVGCYGDSTGTATIAAMGGTPGYGFAWSNGGAGATQDGLPAGNYTVSVTDVNGCEATIQVTISQPSVLAGNLTVAGESAVDANDGTISLAMSGGVAPYTYLWSNNATTAAITGLAPGQYCVSVTDANLCSFTGCATVVPFGCTGLVLTFSSENVSCAGTTDGMAMVTATGFADPLTYLWSNGGTGNVIGNLSAGTYIVIVTDANGCESSDTIDITAPSVLGVGILAQDNLECAGTNNGLLSVEGNGGTPPYAYTWSNGETTATIDELAAGDYVVTVSDANNCTAVMLYQITVLPDMEAPVAQAMDLSVSLDQAGTANITVAMVDDGSTDNCGIVSRTLDISTFNCAHLGTNTVTLTVTDAAGNSSVATSTVEVLDESAPILQCPPNITITDVGCEAVVDYAIPTAVDNCGVPTVALVAGFESGTSFPIGITVVTWAAKDSSGNNSNCSFMVTVISNFVVTTNFTMPTCQGDNDGTATASPIGGTPPYTFAWNDPGNQTTQMATGLSAGSYNVTVTDFEGCSIIQALQVTEPTPLTIIIENVLPETTGQMNGAIDISIGGGTGGYSFQWFYLGAPFSSEEDLSGLQFGEYMVEVTDQSGCVSELTIEVPMTNTTRELNLDNQLTLAPNPTFGLIYLRFGLEVENQVVYQVFDLSGKAVLPMQTAAVSSKSIEIDMRGAPAGVYFLRAIVKGSVVVKRLVLGE